jgi:hypothetical protein
MLDFASDLYRLGNMSLCLSLFTISQQKTNMNQETIYNNRTELIFLISNRMELGPWFDASYFKFRIELFFLYRIKN